MVAHKVSQVSVILISYKSASRKNGLLKANNVSFLGVGGHISSPFHSVRAEKDTKKLHEPPTQNPATLSDFFFNFISPTADNMKFWSWIWSSASHASSLLILTTMWLPEFSFKTTVCRLHVLIQQFTVNRSGSYCIFHTTGTSTYETAAKRL